MKEFILNNISVKIAFQAQVSLVLFWVLARLSVGEFNPTYFAVIAQENTTIEIDQNTVIQPSGYDGQFFYRYALKPLDKSESYKGLKVDHPEYRIQRQGYPITVWLMSFGNEKLVPIMLILSNVLAFLFVLWLAHYWFNQLHIDRKYTWLFFFIYGIHMAIARDLAEVFEVLGVMLALFFLWKRNFWAFAISGSLVLFYRETAIIAVAPLAFLFGLLDYQQNKKLNAKWIWLTLPILTLVGWKMFIKWYIGIESGVDGSQNLSFPFWGLLVGAIGSLRFNIPAQIAESVVWMMYLLWQVWMIVLVIRKSPKINFKQLEIKQVVLVAFLVWVGFSTILGPAIYVDDWGFVRIFSVMNLLGILLISFNKIKLSSSFVFFSIVMLAGTLFRVIIKV